MSVVLRANGSLNYWVKWRLGPEEPPLKSQVSLASTTVTGLSVDVHHVFGAPDRGCVATSRTSPVNNVHCHRFNQLFILQLCFFGFVLLLIPNMLLSLHYAVRVHVKSPI